MTIEINILEKWLSVADGIDRVSRANFIESYANEVYALLTEDFTQYHRLADLVYHAAEQFPGLVPTRAQILAERGKIQSEKKDLEIDQGIFFRGLLRSSRVGSHLADAMLLPCDRALSLQDKLLKNDQINLGSVFYERRNSAAYLTINNQYCLNAEDNNFIHDIETAVDLALLDRQVNVGVLRGGEMTHPRYLGKRVFCAGINLSDLHAGKISFVDFILTREFGYISKIIHGHALAHAAQKPWIAAVDSFAIGGGMQLLLAFDKVIAADDAYFSLPAAKEGIVPGAANFRLSRIAGPRLARQIILSGRKILATEPQAQYICDEVVPTSKMEIAIEEAVQAFNNPAVAENRRMLNLAEEPRERFIEYMAEFSYTQTMRMYSQDVLTKISRWVSERGTFTKDKSPCL